MKYTGKTMLWYCNELNYRMKLLIVNILVNNKLRDLIFGYVIAVIMTVMSINFLRNQQVLLKVTTKLI